MDLMQLRRSLMMQKQAEPEGVGIFTKSYHAILTPGATNSFVVQHNLGIIPRFCIVELLESTRVRANSYVTDGMVDFDVHGMANSKTGMGMFLYHYNNDAAAAVTIPDTAKLNVDENTITFGYPYGTSRSNWDTGAQYEVFVWG